MWQCSFEKDLTGREASPEKRLNGPAPFPSAALSHCVGTAYGEGGHVLDAAGTDAMTFRVCQWTVFYIAGYLL